MKVLYYDVFCGISGDMHLGALLDLGVSLAYKHDVSIKTIYKEVERKIGDEVECL